MLDHVEMGTGMVWVHGALMPKGTADWAGVPPDEQIPAQEEDLRHLCRSNGRVMFVAIADASGIPLSERKPVGVVKADDLWEGLMASDVEKVCPQAVIRLPNGDRAVNYTLAAMCGGLPVYEFKYRTKKGGAITIEELLNQWLTTWLPRIPPDDRPVDLLAFIKNHGFKIEAPK